MKRTAIFFLLLVFLSTTLLATAIEAKKTKKSKCGGGETSAYANDIMIRVTLTGSEKRKLATLKAALIKDGINKKTVEAALGHKNFGLYDTVTKLFKSNPEKKVASGEETYRWYSECLGGEYRVHRGKKFLKKERTALAGAEKKYGVDKRYIVSIIGVESTFATDPGRFNAVNTLASLYVLVKRKKKFAYWQLKELLKYSNRTNKPASKYTSSYAGAIGCGQFIPSSLNEYFVGKAGNVEKADPFNTTDCIYSIAYYLKRSRWDKRQNGTTPKKGSKNWKAIRAYNHSDAYTRFIIEMATKLPL
ncbi:MAG: lytic murein transglycosylase [Thermodesulfobacteriota bacterium]